MREHKLVSVIGGNGFLGKYVVNNLLNKGYYIKIIARTASLSKQSFTINKPGQYKLVDCDIKNFIQLKSELEGSDYVINLVGLLVNKKNNSFKDVHELGVKNIASTCKNLQIKKFIHVSAIGAQKNSKSEYAKTKFYGEEAVKTFDNYCIIRPSIVYGDEDNFINFFAKIAKISPFLPLIGGGKNLFQPIWVQDLANIIVNILENNINRKVLEVGGPEVFSFKKILEIILEELHLRRQLITVPYGLSKRLASLLEFLPNPLLTIDQVEMLKKDNIISKKYDYKKTLKYLPMPFKKMLRNQLSFMKKNGGHLN
ncbi:complex I NDUFA9 subunit family protein [Alphaproteobacteria bacterium]|nr:complex I NDUFA9 subunit family protein [Alphaproteobacteria bacterium]|tara:strand:- start:518 stop:1453 length:936 start_codon:yes stop_codon:yes gene_type:complete